MFRKELFCFRKKRGQGILEVVIAMSVIVIGLVSIMSLVFFNINVQNYNHNMLVASNLAREGIEIIRNVRDSNWLNSDKDWDESLFIEEGSTEDEDANSFVTISWNQWPNFPERSSGYGIVPAGMLWENCINDEYQTGSAICKLSLIPLDAYPSYKIFSHSINSLVGEDTNFYRMIYINEICAIGTEENILNDYRDFCENHGRTKIGMQVISKVGWKNKGSMKIIEVEERIYNWK
jgi:type II secretory pathway pseudopilin PulG